ncbi:26S proteasome non-ATPase regulatory subunit 9-like [Pecten maximus]|uniref:26S proteasome non-ATPase regulatory subunit 9-like n=1 Tax=Pecten maximus TaxID=6579 RepID=UPI0014585E81|nr:26S proteasome non-ATPase regulatory subunit 9-like [Pecten maximus]
MLTLFKMAASMENINHLMKRKAELEAEIKALNDVLDSQQGVGLKEPLVDQEGFPRADIDVYSVRHARHQIICLQNDHKSLMAEIEEELYKIHAEARKQKGESMDTNEDDGSVQAQSLTERLSPFAEVDRVDEGSPASEAGLKVGDAILEFGSITAIKFQSLQNIASVVQHSKDNALKVIVRRNNTDKSLNLTPKTWSGRGLLGCNIVPVKR